MTIVPANTPAGSRADRALGPVLAALIAIAGLVAAGLAVHSLHLWLTAAPIVDLRL